MLAVWYSEINALKLLTFLYFISYIIRQMIIKSIFFRLAATFGVTRKEQDDFARRSHQMAADARDKGYLDDIVPVKVSVFAV